jgi:hypothetical protein
MRCAGGSERKEDLRARLAYRAAAANPSFRSGFPHLTPRQACQKRTRGFLHGLGALLQPSSIPDPTVIVAYCCAGCEVARSELNILSRKTEHARGKPGPQTPSARKGSLLRMAQPASSSDPAFGSTAFAFNAQHQLLNAAADPRPASALTSSEAAVVASRNHVVQAHLRL